MNLNIDIYLRSAFRELDIFSIPDLGTFHKKYRTAQIAEENGVLHPPEIEVVFDSSVNSDFLLSKHLISSFRMSAEEAQVVVSKINTSISASIEKNGKFIIPEMGELQKAENGTIAFSTYGQEKNELADDYFGLKPVAFQSINQIVLPQKESFNQMKNENKTESVGMRSSVGWKSFLLVALIATLGVVFVNYGPSGLSDENPFIKRRSSLTQGLRVRFMPPPRFADAGDVNTDVEEFPTNESTTQQDESTSSTPQTTPEAKSSTQEVEIASKNSADNEVKKPFIPSNELIAEGKSNARESLAPNGATRGGDLGSTRGDTYGKVGELGSLEDTSENEKTATVTDNSANARVLPKTTNYHLIAGSFSSLQAANKFVSQLKSEGYHPIIIFPPAGSSLTHRVSIYRNSSRGKVQDFSGKLKKLGKKSGWIYEEKP